ncbi:MAG: ABC transporter ATP-binding protein [Rhodobacterales bacterium]|jgi:glycerol transport system ATP-binding protein|tara:strand:+ start:329 stop:1393 length:1065 start_codon:yes stop_codon:yes gene_type:complete
MANIKLEGLRHSYADNPKNDEDWALKQIDLEWEDGGAYALLGPSGCGKTTLLNIISGLLQPSHGSIKFDDLEVNQISTDKRDIAQIFQFPVVYDTMSVYDNLAFPLRNLGLSEEKVNERVTEIAQLVELTSILTSRASGLTAGDKQKISLGRGLVRTKVNAILFDEPLTVIDPHLKWQLRSKLKKLHKLLNRTMIYVTHDQIEALTFADKVVVMNFGEVLQIGTPVELFEKPKHTFVGHFIGSPGMNILPCKLDGDNTKIGQYIIETASQVTQNHKGKNLEIGVRPEFIKFSDDGLPVSIVKVSNVGHAQIVETSFEGHKIKLIIDEDVVLPSNNVHLSFNKEKTYLYVDSWLV